jgi:O-antigen/teichoic acid export membrane protein
LAADHDPGGVSPTVAAQEPADVLGTSAAGPAAVRGGAMRLGGYLLGAVASAGSAALLFRHLGVDRTGRYVSVLTLVALVAGVSDLGLTAIGVRESAVRDPRERATMLSDLLGLRMSLTTIGVIVMVGVALVGYPEVVVFGVMLGGFGLLLQTIQDNLSVPLVVALRLGVVTGLDLLRLLLTVAAIAALVLAGSGLLPLLAIPIPVGAIVLVVTALLVRSERSLLPTFDWQRVRPLLRQILPYSLATAAATLYFRVAIVMVSQLAGAHELGLFGASFRIIEVLTAVPALLTGSALPIFARAARDDHDRLGYALGRVFEVALIVGLWVAISIVIGARLAIEIVGGNKFAGSIGVLQIQGVALGATFVSIVWSTGLLSLALHRQILILNVGALILSVVLLAVLVPLDGARGAAIAILCGEVAAAVVGATMVVRGRPALRPQLERLPRIAVAGALALAPLALSGVPVIVRLVISTVLYAGALTVMKAIPPELGALFPRFGGRSGASA